MIIKPICPECLELAFEYYVGNDVDLMREDVCFQEPIACEHCGFKMKKIHKNSGTLERGK